MGIEGGYPSSKVAANKATGASAHIRLSSAPLRRSGRQRRGLPCSQGDVQVWSRRRWFASPAVIKCHWSLSSLRTTANEWTSIRLRAANACAPRHMLLLAT